MSRLATLAVVLLVASVPEGAQACAVCFDGNGESRVAFIATTAFLTFLPLTLIGLGVWYLRTQALRIAAEEADAAMGRVR